MLPLFGIERRRSLVLVSSRAMHVQGVSGCCSPRSQTRLTPRVILLQCKDEITAVDYFTEARTLFAWVGCQEAEGSCLLRLGEAFMEADPAFAKGCLTEVSFACGRRNVAVR